MRCPNCESHIEIEDWTDDESFECESCGETLKLEVDEGTYCGANNTRLVILDEGDD